MFSVKKKQFIADFRKPFSGHHCNQQDLTNLQTYKPTILNKNTCCQSHKKLVDRKLTRETALFSHYYDKTLQFLESVVLIV